MNLLDKYKDGIPEKTRKIIELCSNAANLFSVEIYLIGGVVRDLLLGKQSFDIDITVVGDATKFASFLEEQYPEVCSVKQLHDDFKTAKVNFVLEGEKFEIDFASTRVEYYKEPAALPTLSNYGCDLESDVRRRDFTINSMALSLNKESFCELIDHLGGYEDLNNKLIRLLHSRSFNDDPTRIIRGVKFRVRFNCTLEDETFQKQQNTIESGHFDGLCGERVRSEIKQTLNLNQSECYDLLVKEKVYRFISSEIDAEELPKGEHIYNLILKYESSLRQDFEWLIYLSTFLENHTKQEVLKITDCLNLSGAESQVLFDYKDMLEKHVTLEHDLSRFEIYEFFENYSKEAIVALISTCRNEKLKIKIELYLRELQLVAIKSKGSDLVKMGLTPGPVFKEILRELLRSKVNLVINTDDQESNLLSSLVNSFLND